MRPVMCQLNDVRAGLTLDGDRGARLDIVHVDGFKRDFGAGLLLELRDLFLDGGIMRGDVVHPLQICQSCALQLRRSLAGGGRAYTAEHDDPRGQPCRLQEGAPVYRLSYSAVAQLLIVCHRSPPSLLECFDDRYHATRSFAENANSV